VKEEGLQGAGRGGGTDATEHPLTLARSSVGEEASSFEEPGGGRFMCADWETGPERGSGNQRRPS
jgi:hypothetical protein